MLNIYKHLRWQKARPPDCLYFVIAVQKRLLHGGAVHNHVVVAIMTLVTPVTLMTLVTPMTLVTLMTPMTTMIKLRLR